MRAWLFQDTKQKKKLGEDKCPWSVGWYDPDGKKKSKRVGSHSNAEKFARRIEGQLAAGTYQDQRSHSKSWKDFRTEYESNILARTSPANRMSAGAAMDHFERIAKIAKVNAVRTATIDQYVSQRRVEEGEKKKSFVSPATINKELRHINAALRKAAKWGYLRTLPDVEFMREPVKQPRYVKPEDFAAIYRSCKVATLPLGLPYKPEDWWKAFLTFAFMTGWRVGEILQLRREDIDLDAGTALTRHDDNKGQRDDVISLHPLLIDHLKLIRSFHAEVFPWHQNRRTVWDQFHAIQKDAGIRLVCRDEHEHTEGCHLYGFHDFRRAFATLNAANLTADALQRLMRHRDYSTTQRYINMARQMQEATAKLYIPEVLKSNAAL